MNFDRVADVYDCTRTLPDDVVERTADRIVAATRLQPDSKILDFGIGTGRISLPLVRRGFSVTGVDISTKMMERLRAKLGPDAETLQLVQADIADLPLPDATFDVVLTVHVLHLVAEWRRALQEARRVLEPDGYFVMGHDSSLPDTPAHDIRQRWRELVLAAGEELRPAYGSWAAVDAELTAQGARTAVYRVAIWEREVVPMELIDALRERVFSQTWEVSDVVLERVHQQLFQWSQERYGNLEQAVPSQWELLLSVSTFPQ